MFFLPNTFNNFTKKKDDSANVTYDKLANLKWRFRAPSPENLELIISKICSEYNNSIKKAKTDDDKLEVIAKCIQELERVHPFCDINGRTFGILLQLLLMQNNFLPTMLENLNHIDGLDRKSFIEKIIEGIKRTEFFLTSSASAKDISKEKEKIVDAVNFCCPEVYKESMSAIDEFYRATLSLAKLLQLDDVDTYELATKTNNVENTSSIHQQSQNPYQLWSKSSSVQVPTEESTLLYSNQ